VVGSREGADGRQRWIKAVDLRPSTEDGSSQLIAAVRPTSALLGLRT
jgi:hypothetical protein